MDLNKYLVYPAVFEKDEDALMVRIKNDGSCANCSEEFINEGNNFDDAKEMAVDCVICMAEALLSDKVKMPSARDFQKDDLKIELPYHVALKIMLRNLMIDKGVSLADLSRMVNITPQRMNQYISLRKNTNIDTIASFYKVLGLPLKISF